MATIDSFSYLSGFSSPWQSAAKIKFNPQAYSDSWQLSPTAQNPTVSSPGLGQDIVGASVPSTKTATGESIEDLQRRLPMFKELMAYNAQTQLAYDQAAMQQAYPYLSQAAAEATARNLAASKSYATFKEALPSNVQNIMASKQSQMASAAAAEAERGRAMAAQQEAATNFARRYAGQTFSTG